MQIGLNTIIKNFNCSGKLQNLFLNLEFQKISLSNEDFQIYFVITSNAYLVWVPI